MNFIGIDPGLQGGIATITLMGSTDAIPIPTGTVMVNKKKRRVVDYVEVANIFKRMGQYECFAVIEQQQSRPAYFKDKQGNEKKQGATSLYSTGCGFCLLRQALADFGIPHEIVSPKDWQREFGISGKKGNTKMQSIEICKRLFPNLSLLPTPKSRVDSDGLADAALLALYCKRRNEGKLNIQKKEEK